MDVDHTTKEGEEEKVKDSWETAKAIAEEAMKAAAEAATQPIETWDQGKGWYPGQGEDTGISTEMGPTEWLTHAIDAFIKGKAGKGNPKGPGKGNWNGKGKGKGGQGECWNCGKTGHQAWECWSKGKGKGKAYYASKAENGK